MYTTAFYDRVIYYKTCTRIREVNPHTVRVFFNTPHISISTVFRDRRKEKSIAISFNQTRSLLNHEKGEAAEVPRVKELNLGDSSPPAQ